jgi:fructokinase
VVNVADTVGAGDSFISAFMASILKGEDIRTAHELAVKISAYVCTRYGAMLDLPKEMTL